MGDRWHKHKTIGEMVRPDRLSATNLRHALDWSERRDYEFGDLIVMLETAVRLRDFDNQCRATGQIKAVVVKMLTSLPKVIKVLADGVPQAALDYTDLVESAINRGDTDYALFCLAKLRAIGLRPKQQPDEVAPKK